MTKGVIYIMNQTNNTRLRRRRRKKSPFRRFLRFLLLVLLLFGISAVGYGGYLAYQVKSTADKSFNELDREKSDLRLEKVELGEDPITILLMGIESYAGSPGHADAVILLAINPETNQSKIVSIPRDTRTYLPIIERKDKIGNSYAYGKKGEKEQATIESVEELLDVPIDYYVSTNFKGFPELVDEVGGIDVDVPFNFSEGTLDGKMAYFKKGEMHLNGKEALAYVRMRKQDKRGDFGRQERQLQAIKAIANEAISIKSITRADDILGTVGDNIKTNISLHEMFALRNFYNKFKNNEIPRSQIVGTDEYIDNVYYYVPDDDSLEEISSELQQLLKLENQNQTS
jgi:polyisoprenyl-teichoic acid--peptidoglycan teichoic acid transferase